MATPSLRRNAEFTKMWVGYSISRIGSEITVLALPLTAVLLLGAGATETGLLVAARNVPVFGALFIGVWVDRHRRKPMLVWGSVASAIAIGSVPLAAAIGAITLWQLYAVAFVGGGVTILTQTARTAFLPSLVGRPLLVAANSRLQAADAVAQVAGPSLGGALVQAVTAPVAMAIDAVTFVVSAVSVALMRVEEVVRSREDRQGMRAEIAEGLRFLRDHDALFRAVVAITLANVEWFAVQAVLIVYATRDLHLSPAVLGIALAASGPTSVVGAAIAAPLIARIGLGPTMIAGLVCEAVSRLLLPFAGGSEIAAAVVLAITQALVGLTVPLWSVGLRTLQQAVTPDRLLGRVGAATGFIQFGVAPPAALAAGILGDTIGLRPTLLVAGLIAVVAVIYLLPLRAVRAVPSVRTDEVPSRTERTT
jgi:MFS family permease